MIHLYAVLILFVVVTVSQISALFAQGNERVALDSGSLPSNEGVSFYVRRGQRRYEEQGTQLEKPLPSPSVESASSVHNNGEASQGNPNPALRTKPIPPKGTAKPAVRVLTPPLQANSNPKPRPPKAVPKKKKHSTHSRWKHSAYRKKKMRDMIRLSFSQSETKLIQV